MTPSAHDAIIKTLLAVEKKQVDALNKFPNAQRCCFELYGFDVIFDTDCKAWIIQIDSKPGFGGMNPLDECTAAILQCDTINLVGIHPYNKSQTPETSPFEESMDMAKLEGLVKDKKGFLPEDKLNKHELALVYDFEEEEIRIGNFQRIFPKQENAMKYLDLMEEKRYQNFF